MIFNSDSVRLTRLSSHRAMSFGSFRITITLPSETDGSGTDRVKNLKDLVGTEGISKLNCSLKRITEPSDETTSPVIPPKELNAKRPPKTNKTTKTNPKSKILPLNSRGNMKNRPKQTL